MKKVKCSGPGCSERRCHHEFPDKPRGIQWIEVPDDFPEDGKAYCSIDCAMYAKALRDRGRIRDENKNNPISDSGN